MRCCPSETKGGIKITGDFSAAFVFGVQFRLIPTNAEIFAPVISMPQSKDSRSDTLLKKKNHENTILGTKCTKRDTDVGIKRASFR